MQSLLGWRGVLTKANAYLSSIDRQDCHISLLNPLESVGTATFVLQLEAIWKHSLLQRPSMVRAIPKRKWEVADTVSALMALGVKKCRQGYVVTFGKSWFAGFIVGRPLAGEVTY